MRWKPLLTNEELRAIQERNKESQDSLVLLWEVARLRSVVLHADHLQRVLGSLPGQQGQMLDLMREVLRTELCVLEFPQLQ
jgi:hypothetical protein